jgi:hypothetical protein
LLRHTVATLAYRGGKAVRGASPEFATFKAGPTSRTPAEILAHIGDLLDWALSIAEGEEKWHNGEAMPWNEGVARFHAALEALDDRLASGAPLAAPPEKLFQGPIADALTHVGQINLLRRIAAQPVRGENYFRADIGAGRVGVDQPKSKVEFD